MTLKEKIICRLHFKKSFNRGFDCKCRICGSEAEIFTVDNEDYAPFCSIVIRCPKCEKNYIKF